MSDEATIEDGRAQELRDLETKYTLLMEQFTKLQTESATRRVEIKQLKGACARFDQLVSYLTGCIATIPIDPQMENAAINLLAATLHSVRGELQKTQGVLGMLQRQAEDNAKAKAEANAEPKDQPS